MRIAPYTPHSLITSVLLCTALTSTMAFAQGPKIAVEEIVITAQKRAEPLSKVPIAVTIAGEADLQKAGAVTALDLPMLVPGLAVGHTSQANVYFTPVLRGVGAPTPAVGNDNSVAVYIDGIYQSDKTLSVFEFNNIERIEVLKGPQGTLFGRNATGGAINIITKQPNFEPSANAEAFYGRFDEWSAKAYFTAPLGKNMAFNFSYAHHEGGDFLENINPLYAGKFGGVNGDSITGSVLWKPTEELSINASVLYAERETTNLMALSPVVGSTPLGSLFGGISGDAPYTYAGSPVRATTDLLQASLRIRYSLPGFDIISLTGYVDGSPTQALDYDGTSADMFMFKNFLDVEDISEELQFISTTDGPFEWVAGLYYYEGDPRSDPLFIIQNAPYDVTPSNILDYPGGSITMVDTAGKVKAKAVYGQAGYKVTDDTKITLGLRYTEEKRGYNYAVFGIGELAPGFVVPVLAPLDATTRPSETFKKLTWRLALDHNFTDDIMGYISYNRGFKSGVYNHSDFTPTQVAVRPEVLDAYEVGVKSKWLDHRVQVNAAAFYYDYKNIQVSRIDATTTATQTLENAAKEEIYGLDLDLVIQASEALQLRAGANWLHAKYTDFEDASGFVVDENGFVTPASINATGTRGILAPKFSFNIGADYRAALGNNGSLLFSGYVFYTDKYKTVVGEGNQVFSHALVNASVTWYSPDEKYYIRLSGENLTDKKVTATSTSPFRLARYEIQPISWGIAVGANF